MLVQVLKGGLNDKMRKNDKRGFSTLNAIVGGVIGFVFLAVIGMVFITQLNDTNLLAAASAEQNASDALLGNFSDTLQTNASQIGTVVTIGFFVLIISVLIIAWVFAKRNGLVGGGQLG